MQEISFIKLQPNTLRAITKIKLKECKKYSSEEDLYKSEFWDKCRPLVLSSSDETEEKKHQNFINLITYFYDKSPKQRMIINWLVLRSPFGDDYWVKKSK